MATIYHGHQSTWLQLGYYLSCCNVARLWGLVAWIRYMIFNFFSMRLQVLQGRSGRDRKANRSIGSTHHTEYRTDPRGRWELSGIIFRAYTGTLIFWFVDKAHVYSFKNEASHRENEDQLQNLNNRMQDAQRCLDFCFCSILGVKGKVLHKQALYHWARAQAGPYRLKGSA